MEDKMKMIWEEIQNAQKLLIGIGGEFAVPEGEALSEEVRAAYEAVLQLTEGKDYYIMTSNRDDGAVQCGIPEDHLAAPARDEEEEHWEKYNRWLSMTLNRRLVISELGEGFANPGMMRWPFEKICFLNQQAKLIRVHGKFPQLAAELGEKGIAVKENSTAFVRRLVCREED